MSGRTSGRAVLFDDGKGQLAPLTDLRPAFEIRTGAFLTWERQCALLGLTPGSVCVPSGLAEAAASRWTLPVNRPPEPAPSGLCDGVHDGSEEREDIVLINGRCPLPPVGAIGALPVGGALIEPGTSDIIAARLTLRDTRALLSGGAPDLDAREHTEPSLMARPWDWRRFRDACLDADLALLTARMPRLSAGDGVTVLGTCGVFTHPSVRVWPTAVLDSSAGPIVLDENVIVRPQALIVGPAYVGPGSTVLDKAFIKAHTSIGPVCKVTGEIGGTILQGYTNKAHDGHLGDSYLGEWCNLGAGTVNSNLLNTYSEVLAQATPGGRHERTGQTFLGCTMGDHVRTAIGTRIMTGAVVGTGTMWAAGAALSGTLGPFGWHTDAGHGDSGRVFRLAKFFEAANAAMARRGVAMPVAVSRRITVLHETLTGTEAISWPGKDRSHLMPRVGNDAGRA
jgi:UDP-N-acetylglucosamine diphosphorylase/glucosamine-1-phosphate N-acetyltransferase